MLNWFVMLIVRFSKVSQKLDRFERKHVSMCWLEENRQPGTCTGDSSFVSFSINH